VEAIVLPMTHKERFETLGIRPPKGVLLYGPPGTGKTLIARACAAQTNACFLKLAGPLLVQMFIGDGAKLVRDAFALAKEKGPTIIFIDEIDAIGTKRFDSELSGDREVQRTMLELLNQLDGFSSDDRIKVIAATNRADILDPALLRSGRLDRKIEFPHPNEEARARIIQIHARKMSVSPDVNYEELARSTDDFNAAQLKAVCVEAGILALRRDGVEVNHEDFNEGIIAVQAKKKASGGPLGPCCASCSDPAMPCPVPGETELCRLSLLFCGFARRTQWRAATRCAPHFVASSAPMHTCAGKTGRLLAPRDVFEWHSPCVLRAAAGINGCLTIARWCAAAPAARAELSLHPPSAGAHSRLRRARACAATTLTRHASNLRATDSRHAMAAGGIFFQQQPPTPTSR
jgi:hypothetical protein